MNAGLENAQDVFLDKINLICKKFGLNSIMAQLYAILYFSEKPLSLNDMVDRLKISKGSASINIRALERYGAVRSVWVKGSRKDYYEAEKDIEKVIMERVRNMAKSRLSEVDNMISASSDVLKTVGGGEGLNDGSVRLFRERLDRLRDIYDRAKSLFDVFNAMICESGSKETKESLPAAEAGLKDADSLELKSV